MKRRDEYEAWLLDMIARWWWALLLALVALLWLSLNVPSSAATMASLSWTSQGDPVRLVQVRAPGDTMNRNLWADSLATALKSTWASRGQTDHGWVSVSTAFYERGAYRLLLMNEAGASNPLSLFWVARSDSFGLRPQGGMAPGVGLKSLRQGLDDATWPEWVHLEVVQRESRACALFGYAARRGVRDTTWCQP